jgi:hypothetical protein
MRLPLNILFIFILFSLVISCEKENMNSSNDAELGFSTDTITFDTIFTSIGSQTKNVRAINTTGDALFISSIRLAGGKESGFRLNIDGESTDEVVDVEIPPGDSIFIFVEATLGETGGNIPLVVEDSIVFSVNGNEQSVNLLAWGQDFNLIRSTVLETTTWTNEKPYLVYDYVYVDSLSVLTIEPGTIIHFHDGAGMYVKGTIEVNGTFDEPVIFQGDKLESMFSDVPDQWDGIIIFSGSHNNKINNALIKNANTGLQVGTLEHEGFASLEIKNSRIENMSWSGIWAMKSKILASNCVISNVRYYNTALLLGGEYQFYHTTFGNYYNGISTGVRNTETLVISNYINDNNNNTHYVGDMKKAVFGNCIVAGDLLNELSIRMDKQGESNFLFDHCLLQIPDTLDISDTEHYSNIIRSNEPGFINPYKGNFELDTLSISKDVGKLEFGKLFPVDFNENGRLEDAGPDLGAFERVEKDHGNIN